MAAHHPRHGGLKRAVKIGIRREKTASARNEAAYYGRLGLIDLIALRRSTEPQVGCLREVGQSNLY